ncbi:MAG: UDP-3-O-[3-hydroxymyristoyl] N-acetylglucosamine deacetylase [Pirellulales bacterium]|nr:UDP-3-O-[3-hydroxymyristoyl] N-acetylglucosamine deacetylase [Pirellulales bacterium]
MPLLAQQCTIARPVRLDGFGFFGGRDVSIEFRPAEVNSGLAFVRRDLPVPVRIPASADHRIDQPRRTVLEQDGLRVEMVEHVLSALAGLAIDNCEVWTDQPEMPGCDGSARLFVDALSAAGIVELEAPRRCLMVNRTIRVGDENSWLEARPNYGIGLSIHFCLDYHQGPIGRQEYSLSINPDSFCRELAPARTFLLREEAEVLVNQKIGRRVTPRDLLIFDQDGPTENRLRFENECVRHKILDIVGDLALAECDISGHIVGYRSGHVLNAELVKVLLETHSVVESPMLRASA